MTTLATLEKGARSAALALRGVFHPEADESLPEATRTLVLLGPDEPRFWAHFTASAEYDDGLADPLDRWSVRVIGALAERVGGTALFPSDGPPYPPFIAWALASDVAWSAPVGLLVHETAGLFSSYRGAIALPDRLPLPARPSSPCLSCSQRPCESTCPVGAMAAGQPYDVPRCRAHILSEAGAACREGCLVRRACPVSQRFGRLPAQSAFHMKAFVGE